MKTRFLSKIGGGKRWLAVAGGLLAACLAGSFAYYYLSHPGQVEIKLTPTRQFSQDGRTAMPPTGRLEGSVDYDDSLSLPEGSELVVRLQQADTDDGLIAEQTIADPGRPPLTYTLTYGHGELTEAASYAITGRVYGPGGETLLINRRPQITAGRDDLQQISDLILLPAAAGHGQTAVEPDAAIEITLTYESRSGLPEGSILVVQLRDVSDQTAAESVLEQSLENPGPSPIRLRIDYFAADLAGDRRYSLSAAIYSSEGRLLFVNDPAREVVVRGPPPRIDIHLIAI